MGLARVHSRAGLGIEAPEVSVEVHLGGGLPSLSIVGMPETAVRESKDRVRAALVNGGFEFPARRITISLAPADLPKDGGRFDLPIALGILAASRQVVNERLNDSEFTGELGLNGDLRPVHGILPIALRARERGRMLVLPAGNAREAGLVAGGQHRSAVSLLQVVSWLNGQGELEAPSLPPMPAAPGGPDLACVRGQQRARRALEIAAAGGHNMLMTGPPGTGKTLLASCLPGILPDLTPEEALETAVVASISRQGLMMNHWHLRPFRAPHHSCSGIALVGGGTRPKPGEISLAHNGVLFLDELPEFKRSALEVLREPLESGRIVISRAMQQAEFPARFQLLAAMNPCPCGYAGDKTGRCHCSSEQVRRYRGRISGPLLDRIDIHVEVSRPEVSLLNPERGDTEPSSMVKARVMSARQHQVSRSGCCNANLDAEVLLAQSELQAGDIVFLEKASKRFHFSPRTLHRVLKVARTVADLEGQDQIGTRHLAEAIGLRSANGA